jgi:hypothetical protein
MYPTGFSTQGHTKLFVAWKDGKKKYFRSFDTSGRFEVKDPKAYGLRGLKKTFFKDCNPANVNRAIIYDVASGQPLEEYINGQWVAAQAA